jgi:hypothetical protein
VCGTEMTGRSLMDPGNLAASGKPEATAPTVPSAAPTGHAAAGCSSTGDVLPAPPGACAGRRISPLAASKPTAVRGRHAPAIRAGVRPTFCTA